MQGIFAEAGADLAEKLSSLLVSPVGGNVLPPVASPASPPDSESVDETIKMILK